MSKPKSRHSCFVEIDKRMAKFNTRLTANMFDDNCILIATEKVDPSIRGKPKIIVCSYCPCCGKKLDIK